MSDNYSIHGKCSAGANPDRHRCYENCPNYENRQVEEIARIMNEVCNVYDEQGNHIRNKCYECEEWSADNYCCCSYNKKQAKTLYNAGYRRQSEGKWETFQSLGTSYRCSICKKRSDKKTLYCPNCGAEMKRRKEINND